MAHARQSAYQARIAKTIPADIDPRHVEAWMRVGHGTLDHLAPAAFDHEAAVPPSASKRPAAPRARNSPRATGCDDMATEIDVALRELSAHARAAVLKLARGPTVVREVTLRPLVRLALARPTGARHRSFELTARGRATAAELARNTEATP
jgi:hypothetical protein